MATKPQHPLPQRDYAASRPHRHSRSLPVLRIVMTTTISFYHPRPRQNDPQKGHHRMPLNLLHQSEGGLSTVISLTFTTDRLLGPTSPRQPQNCEFRLLSPPCIQNPLRNVRRRGVCPRATPTSADPNILEEWKVAACTLYQIPSLSGLHLRSSTLTNPFKFPTQSLPNHLILPRSTSPFSTLHLSLYVPFPLQVSPYQSCKRMFC